MTRQEIEEVLRRLRKNQHVIEKYSKEDLFDMMTFLNEKHREDSVFMSNIYNVNKKEIKKKRSADNLEAIKTGAKKDALKEITLESFVNDRPEVRERKRVFELIEKRYDSLMEPDKEHPFVVEEKDHTKFTMGQIFILLDKLGLFNSTSPFNKTIPLVKDKQKVIQKILGCDNRTAKGLLNGEEKYMPSIENIERVDAFLVKMSEKNANR
jgi:hypothetical protein